MRAAESPPASLPPGRFLLSGPAGSGKTHAALAAIRAAATQPGLRGRGATRPDDALLILPTYAQVNHVKRLALSRWDVRGIFDRPFTTFTAAGERFLEAFRVGALPSAEERDRLMAAALAERSPAVFRPVASAVGFRAHLLRLVKELKQTGLEGGEAREHLAAARTEVGPASRRKLDAFLEVFELYEDLLEKAALEDHEDALRRLAVSLEATPPAAPPRVVVVDGFDDFSQVEERILDALAQAVVAAGGSVLVTLPWDPGRTALFATSRGARQRLLNAGYEESSLTGFPRAEAAPLAHLAANLFGAPSRLRNGGDAVQSVVAGDAEDEAESIARAVRGLRGPDGFIPGVRGWRDVGVVVRALPAHAPRLESAFARLGVPLRVVGAGEALASEPVVRALRGPLAVFAGETEAGRFDAGGLLAWLRWRTLVAGDLAATAALDRWDMGFRQHGFPEDLPALLRKVPAAVREALEILQAQARQLAGAATAEERYSRLEQALQAAAPLPAAAGFDDQGRPRDGVADQRLARAVAALARVGSLVGGLRSAAERTGVGAAADAAEAVQQVREAIEVTSFRPVDRRLDAVTLMDAEEARFWELPVVVVGGLEEGAFPLRPREDVLLRDADRRALRVKDGALRLPLAIDREARERRLFYGAVTRASVRLVLARRAYDDKGNAKERSAYLRELESILTPTILAEARTPGRVVRPSAECYTVQDLRLLAAGRLGPWYAVDETDSEAVAEHAALRDLAPALQSLTRTPAPGRRKRARRRASDPLGYDAPSLASAREAFAAAVESTSVSSLNHGVLCPYRFFLAKVARVPQDDFRLDGPVFDNRDRGTALHYALELALQHPDRTPAELAQAGIEKVGAHGIQEPLLREELERSVVLFREREQLTAGPLKPWKPGLEFNFKNAKAVEIGPEDCRFRLGGEVDRIDRTSEEGGLAAIIDYKRGEGTVERYFAAARDGNDLQLPLYARVVETLLGVRVVGLEWVAGLTRSRRVIHDAAHEELFGSRREMKPLLAEETSEFRERIDSAEATAAAVVRRARAGDHARAPVEAGVCEHCYWQDVCRPDTAWLEAQIPSEADETPSARDEGGDA